MQSKVSAKWDHRAQYQDARQIIVIWKLWMMIDLLPFMQTRMAEVVQTCTLLVTGRLEEVLDPAQQSLKYPAVQLHGLTAVLTKFRFDVILGAALFCTS